MVYIAPCGFDCCDCEAYKATQAKDQVKLAELADKWSRKTHKWTLEIMECDGCLEPRIFGGCLVCAVRECAIEKGVTLCKDCSEYACDKLNYIWKHAKVKPEIIEANYAKAK